jgi:hypothetical protein
MDKVRDKLSKLCTSDSIRIGHAYREDGSDCSIGKDSCMMVTKYHGGYYYYCFRCKDQGWVDEYRSPKQVIADAKRGALQVEEEIDTGQGKKFDVPYDCISAHDLDVPAAVTGWLNRFHITDELIDKYNIQFSPMYDRIIFPIYEYYIANAKKYDAVIGWCGRCYHPFDKEERITNRRPKYLTKKDEGHKHDRVFWCDFAKRSTHTIVVEDIVSAIRLREATDLSVMALLTTSFPTNIMPLFQNTVIIWLDHDAQHKSFKYVTKMNQVGTKSYFVSTMTDPKTFGDEDLQNIIKRRVDNANAFEVA